MSIKTVVSRFNAHHPDNEVEAMVKCGVMLRYIDSGSFRNVYQIYDLPLIAKFPIPDGHGVRHSRHEIRIVRRITRGLKKYAHLQKYMPEVHYMNHATGVILMKRYTLAVKNKRSLDKLEEVGDAFGKTFGISNWDYHQWNFGLGDDNGLVLLDFGCLEHKS